MATTTMTPGPHRMAGESVANIATSVGSPANERQFRPTSLGERRHATTNGAKQPSVGAWCFFLFDRGESLVLFATVFAMFIITTKKLSPQMGIVVLPIHGYKRPANPEHPTPSHTNKLLRRLVPNAYRTSTSPTGAHGRTARRLRASTRTKVHPSVLRLGGVGRDLELSAATQRK